jgi:dihydrofolate reductase
MVGNRDTRRFVMRKLTVSTLVSLDGVIQDPGGFGETDQGGWANQYFTEQARQEALDRLLASDYFLMGRTTYELMYRSWANVEGGGPYLDRTNAMPKLVASKTLTGSLPWNATVIPGDVAKEIAQLKQQDGGDIEMYGSATLMQTLMQHDLIDEYRVAVHPLVLGGGTRLFSDGGVRTGLRLSDARRLDSGVVELIYVPAGRQ